MSERHTTSNEAEQELVFQLMRERLLEMFGSGGSFRVSLGRATADDAVFVATIADTVAEHDELWQQIETDLLVRRTGPDSVDVDVEREASAARDGGSLAERLGTKAA